MDGANSRKSDAAATRKRRSSILKSQRCVRAPLSELEFHVATPDQAKSRRVSFSRRTGVAEFEINEATTAWKNVYEEHNKSLESSANESGLKAAPRRVAHLGARATHFEDAEADDIGADEPPPPPPPATEMSTDTDILQLSRVEVNPATEREPTDLNVDFSAMAPLRLLDDLDALRRDLAGPREPKRDHISEFSIDVDFNATHFSLKADDDDDDDDMSITDTIRSPAVATERSRLDFSVAATKSQVDWTADKENIAVNPYIAPPPAEFACDDEDVLVFDGKKCKFQSKLDLSDEPLSAGTSERVTLPVKEDVISINKSVFLDDMTETHVIPAQILQNSRVDPQRTVVFGSDGVIPTTQAVNTNIIDLKASNVQQDDKENQKTMYFNDMADMSVTQALPADIIEKDLQRRNTIVYGADEGHISMTEAAPAGALVSAHTESILGANKLDNTRRRTIVYDNADVSMTGVVGNTREDKLGKMNDHRTIVYGNDDGNLSVTGVVSDNIIDEAKVTQPGMDRRRTIVYGNDDGNVSMTGVIPAKIINEERVTAQPSTDRRKTIVYDNDDGNVSMTRVLPAKIIDKALEIEQPKTDRRTTIVYGNDDGNVSITGVVPPNIIDESKANPSVERRKTIVYENEEGNLSMTGVAPINILDAPKAFQETNTDRRKTVVFGNDEGNVSMTGVLPVNIIDEEKATQHPIGRGETIVVNNDIDVSLTGVVHNTLEQNRSNVSQPPNTDRRKTVVYGNDDGDLSMTSAVPANIFGQNEANVPAAEREITAVNENDVGNPLTAVASEVLEEQNKADKQPSKEHATAVVSENINRNASMAGALLSNILDNSKTNQPQDVERRETIVCGNNDANISITGVLPANILHKGANLSQFLNGERRQTIVYGNEDVSLTEIIPANVIQPNAECRRTIIYGNDHIDISMTGVLPTNILGEEHNGTNNTESVDKDRRKTVVYDNDEGNVSITGIVPTNIVGQETNERRKTIVYEDNDVSMTGIVPAQIMAVDTNVIVPETLTSVLCENTEQTPQKAEFNSEDNQVEMLDAVSKPQLIESDEDADVSMSQPADKRQSLATNLCSSTFNKSLAAQMGSTTFNKSLAEQIGSTTFNKSLENYQGTTTFNQSLADQVGSTTFDKPLGLPVLSTTFNKSLADQIGSTTFNKSLAEQIGSTTFNKSLADQMGSTTFNKSLADQVGSTTFNKSLAEQIGSTTFNKSLAEQIGSTTFNKSLAEQIGSTTFNKSLAEEIGSATFNKSLADQMGSTTFNKSLADQVGSTSFNKSLADQIGSTTFNKSLAEQIGSTTFNKSLADQMGSTAFNKSLADQMGSTTFNKSLVDQVGSTTFNKSLAEQIGSTTFNKSLAEQIGSTTFNKSLADQVGSTTFNTSLAKSATGQACSTTMNKSLTSQVLVYGVTTTNIQETGADTHTDIVNNTILEDNQSQNASMLKCNSSVDHSHQKSLKSEPVEQIPVVDRSSVLDALLDMTNASVEALQNEPPQVGDTLVKPASDVTVSVPASESYILVKDDDDEPVSKDPEGPALDGSEALAIEYKKQHGIVCKLQRKFHKLKDTLHVREKSPKREPKGTNDKEENRKRSLDTSEATHDISLEKSPVPKSVLKTSSTLDRTDVQEKNKLVPTEDDALEQEQALQGDVTSKAKEKDQSQNTTEINATKCQGDDTRAILDALSDFTSPETTRRISAPDRKSMVISREDLLREISMAQALMKTEMQQTDVELEGTEGSSDEQESAPPRLSGEVVKTLRFEDDDSISEPKVLQKPPAVQPSPRRTPTVIPSYDISEPVKELMNDLIKPTMDGDRPLSAQSNSPSKFVQADNLESSQIDLSPSRPVLIKPRPRIRHESAHSATHVSPRKPVVNVIEFDHSNPLNNVVLPPLEGTAAHAYAPRRSEETCAQTEGGAPRDVEVNTVLTAGRGAAGLLDEQVNTSIAMKLNRELLLASSSLTLVDDALAPVDAEQRGRAPVHVLFGPEQPAQESDRERRRQKRPRAAARGAEVTPKPANKVQKVSAHSKSSPTRRSSSPPARDAAAAAASSTCGSVTTVAQLYACARSDTSDTLRSSRVSDWRPELLHEPSSKNLVCEHEPGADVAAEVALLPFMGTPECSWESRAGDTWAFRLLRGRLRLLVRLELRGNATRAAVRADTPVRVALVEHAALDRDRKDPVASLCLCLAAEALQRVCARGVPRAGAVPLLLRRCAAVARVAQRWGRVMRAARVALAFSLADDGTLSLKVANIPLRSVWEVTLRIGLCDNGRGAPYPRAADVRVADVVAAWAPGDGHVRAVVDAVPDDWGHAPRTVWKLFKYLKNKSPEDDLFAA